VPRNANAPIAATSPLINNNQPTKMATTKELSKGKVNATIPRTIIATPAQSIRLRRLVRGPSKSSVKKASVCCVI
jgi:hypothetical protein